MEPFGGIEKPNRFLVRSLDCYWNQFEASLCVMYGKLERLDFVMIAGEVVYIPREEVRNAWA